MQGKAPARRRANHLGEIPEARSPVVNLQKPIHARAWLSEDTGDGQANIQHRTELVTTIPDIMALQEVTTSFLRRFRPTASSSCHAWSQQCRRYASSDGTSQGSELEQTPFVQGNDSASASEKALKAFNPAATARKRNRRLPPGRYQFKDPRYYRGPLHPHQRLPPSDPVSREFEPGPFSLPRLEQTYNDTLAPDFMTMAYQHFPPGTTRPLKGERLRSWIGDSPYYKNRPLRGPRGGDVLTLLRKPITFKNIPKLERVTVHTMVKAATSNSAPLHVAGMILQAITNVRVEAHAAPKSTASFGIRAGQYLSVTCDLRDENMYHFLSKVVDVVMPKMKDWKGVKGSSGDSSGNLAFGLTSEDVALFPEIEVNYDMYPPKMIPGCHVMIHTTATNDQDARVLLTQVGIPFTGKLID